MNTVEELNKIEEAQALYYSWEDEYEEYCDSQDENDEDENDENDKYEESYGFYRRWSGRSRIGCLPN